MSKTNPKNHECGILSIYQLRKDRQVQEAINDIVSELTFGYTDGASYLCLNFKNNRIKHKRQLNPFFQTETIPLFNNYDVLNFHFRQKTYGEVALKNVHLWQVGNWYFAHNGWGGRYKNEGAKNLTDSLLFFKEIVKRNYIRKNNACYTKKIKELASDNNVSGKFILINKKSKRIYYFGDFHVYLLDRKALVISSEELDFKEWVFSFGMIFSVKDYNLEIAEKEIDGIYVMDLKKRKLKEIDEDSFGTITYKWDRNNNETKQKGNYTDRRFHSEYVWDKDLRDYVKRQKKNTGFII